ncbi:MAG TPA: dephospho-CoA kinase [Pirellulales bacterium]|nr:dephospho-CoA kinase [Pirellulales bacterium]
MKIIGILGGVACGKSLVAKQFADLGAGILDADQAGHEVLRQPEVERAARGRWGDAIFDANGRIERAALAKIVFGANPEAARELKYLEELTHPQIAMRLRRQAGKFAAEKRAAAILDAPVMLKANWNAFCDHILFVDAPWEVRVARARTRGWTAEDVRRREAAQEAIEEKRRWADLVIDNAGPPEHTRMQIERIWQTLID